MLVVIILDALVPLNVASLVIRSAINFVPPGSERLILPSSLSRFPYCKYSEL